MVGVKHFQYPSLFPDSSRISGSNSIGGSVDDDNTDDTTDDDSVVSEDSVATDASRSRSVSADNSSQSAAGTPLGTPAQERRLLKSDGPLRGAGTVETKMTNGNDVLPTHFQADVVKGNFDEQRRWSTTGSWRQRLKRSFPQKKTRRRHWGDLAFRAELKKRAGVRHDRVIRVLAVCFRERELVTVTKYFEKGTLADVLRDTKQALPWSLRIAMLADAASGLAHIHSHGFIQGDFRSQTLLVDELYHVHVDAVPPARAMITERSGDGDGNDDGAGGDLTSAHPTLKTMTDDILDFGMVLWEVCIRRVRNKGRAVGSMMTPSFGYSSKDALGFEKSGLLSGLLVPPPGGGPSGSNGRPQTLPKPLAMLMSSCCAANAQHRPWMSDVVDALGHIAEDYERSNTRSVEGVFGERGQTGNKTTRRTSMSSPTTHLGDLNMKEERPTLDVYSQIQTDELFLLGEVGRGGYGIVYKATYQQSEVAVKIFEPKKRTGEGDLDFDHIVSLFQSEASIIARLRHPNILQFIGACARPELLAIVTTYYSLGSLTQALYSSAKLLSGEHGRPMLPVPSRKNKRKRTFSLGWKECIKSALGTARGLSYLHGFSLGGDDKQSNNIIHHDLKSGNILLNHDYEGVVADFGFTALKQNLSNKRHGGTIKYMAPERILGEEFTESVDIYSLGVVLSELCSHVRPYEKWINKERDDLVPSRTASGRIKGKRSSSRRKLQGIDTDNSGVSGGGGTRDKGAAKNDLSKKLAIHVSLKGLRPTLKVPEINASTGKKIVPIEAFVFSIFGKLAVLCWGRDGTQRPTAVALATFLSDLYMYTKTKEVMRPLAALAINRDDEAWAQKRLKQLVVESSMGSEHRTRALSDAAADPFCVCAKNGEVPQRCLNECMLLKCAEVLTVLFGSWDQSPAHLPTRSLRRKSNGTDEENAPSLRESVVSFLTKLDGALYADPHSYVIACVYVARCQSRLSIAYWRGVTLAAVILAEKVWRNRALSKSEHKNLLPFISSAMPDDLEEQRTIDASKGSLLKTDTAMARDLIKEKTKQLLKTVKFRIRLPTDIYASFSIEFRGCLSLEPMDIIESLGLERRAQNMEKTVREAERAEAETAGARTKSKMARRRMQKEQLWETGSIPENEEGMDDDDDSSPGILEDEEDSSGSNGSSTYPGDFSSDPNNVGFGAALRNPHVDQLSVGSLSPSKASPLLTMKRAMQGYQDDTGKGRSFFDIESKFP
jgi:serine/threonine protein kinase